jgi:hypothetical protein
MKYSPHQLRIGIDNAACTIAYLTRLDNDKFQDLIHRQYIKAERYRKMLTAHKDPSYKYF